MDLGLAERICVVTGASSGIGLATARLLAAEQATVLLVGRRADALAAAAAATAAVGGRTEVLVADVTDVGAPDAALARLAQLGLGSPHVLVNNAGTSTARPLGELTDADWEAQWRLNVMAPMRWMRALAPAMADRGWGRIVNVTSSSGKRPSSTNVAYSVTKSAQLSLSRAFAEAYAKAGVLVNAVAPGVTASELWMAPGGLADQIAQVQGKSRTEAIDSYRERVPRGRFAEPAEIAATIVFLCSEAAANVVGAAWSVDGGSVGVII